MKEIKLTQGKIALVDDEDFEYLNQFKWYALKNRNTYYAQRMKTINGKERAIKMHRIIMNTPKGIETDHRDHNGLNNQKYNLRNITFGQNRMNRLKNKNGSSQYKGVTYNNGYLIAQIKADGILHRLGSFDNEKDAAIAYNEAAIKYHGEFASLNVIE